MKPGLVSLVTLNWHHASDLTIPFIDSLAIHNRGFELIVVDQESGPDAFQLRAKVIQYPWLKLIELEENVGFPRGNNIGLEEAEGEIVLIINNDIHVHGDILSPGKAIISNDPSTIVGGWLREYAGWNEFRQGNKYVHVPYLEGAYLMFHRSILERMGGYLFDDRFGKGCMEDVDFCRRAQLVGLKLCAIDLSLVHYGAKTTGDGRYLQEPVTRANYEIVKEMVFVQ